MNQYIVNVKLPNGSVTKVAVTANSYADARLQAGVFGQVVGLDESRSVKTVW